MRYVYLGDKATAPELVGMECDPVQRQRSDGSWCCIVCVKMATALVVDGRGKQYVVARRRLRVREQER